MRMCRGEDGDSKAFGKGPWRPWAAAFAAVAMICAMLGGPGLALCDSHHLYVANQKRANAHTAPSILLLGLQHTHITACTLRPGVGIRMAWMQVDYLRLSDNSHEIYLPSSTRGKAWDMQEVNP